jgi:type I restriction enzyme R subunit
LNEEATRRWPKEYGAGSTFAAQVTSDIPGAQQMTLDFANNNLSGKSKWRRSEFRDYNTSRTRVCVTVGMMTTGYDCEDILNVVLARPIMSPTDFIQIKGRGTRLFTFKHQDGENEQKIDKDGFGLFDFFANCEYFEKEFNYDEVLKLPRPQGKGREDSGGSGPVVIGGIYEHLGADILSMIKEETIGYEGMKIDRMFFEKFEERIHDGQMLAKPGQRTSFARTFHAGRRLPRTGSPLNLGAGAFALTTVPLAAAMEEQRCVRSFSGRIAGNFQPE